MNLMQIARGDIIWVQFGSAPGRCKTGEHPAIVVQNNVGNQVSPMTIVVPLTDPEQYKDLPVQVLLTSAETGLLNKDSCVEGGHVRCIDRAEHILEERGVVSHLSADVMSKVDAALRISIGL